MAVRWAVVMAPAVAVSGAMLIATQVVFLRMSLFRDKGFGNLEQVATLRNYVAVATDPFYLHSLALTLQVALVVVLCTLLTAYPVAFALTRLPARWSSMILAAIIASALVAEVIKVLGLIVIFSADGLLNRSLLSLGLISAPVSILGNVTGVVIGLLHFTLGFAILLIFSVLQTIPRSLEYAARIHGATSFRAFWRVTLPLSAPGIAIAGLVVFNLSSGAFTAVSLLGGGRILTLPVLIERTMILETKYGMAACLAAVLMTAVLTINGVVALLAHDRTQIGEPRP